MYDDITLLRFLRARKFDWEKTLAMFDKSLKWREEKKVDEMYATFNPNGDLMKEIQELYPHNYHKTDR